MSPGSDPLAGLRGLHLPATPDAGHTAVPWLAIGAGLLAAALLRLAIALIRRAAPRRAALAALVATRAEPAPVRLVAQARVLRGAIAATAGPAAAAERGEAWLARLDAVLHTDLFTRGAGRALGDALYRPGPAAADPEALDAALVPLLRRLRG